MKEYREEFSIEKMARVLGVSRSGYYDFLEKEKSAREVENERLKEQIKSIHEKSRRVYGSPRIHNELKKQGKKCSRRRVAKLMREEGIQAKMRKRWKKTTCANEKAEPSANYLDQNFRTEEPNKVWASDITYIWTEEGWLYVAVVMDLFSRKIVGLSMGERLRTDLVSNALKQAIFRRGVNEGLMHHSDRGCQYTSKEFKELSDRHGIKLSMSGKGHCYDNAVVESFFHTLKTEHTNFYKYRIREEAKTSIFEYIEVFYNRQRAHSTAGYLSPEEFEAQWGNTVWNVA
jgi:transposase InsO family protein